MIVVLFIIVSLTFVMAKKLPGGPFDRERSLPVSIEKNLRAKYHLDEPLLKQYERYMLDLVKGDLGH
jgi:oligopeptide transport system permease protein